MVSSSWVIEPSSARQHAGEVAEVVDGERQVGGQRLPHGLAVLPTLDDGELLEVVLDALSDLQEHIGTLGGTRPAPRVLGGMRGIEREVDVRGGAPGDLAERLAVHGRRVLEVEATDGWDPLAADEVVVAALDVDGAALAAGLRVQHEISLGSRSHPLRDPHAHDPRRRVGERLVGRPRGRPAAASRGFDGRRPDPRPAAGSSRVARADPARTGGPGDRRVLVAVPIAARFVLGGGAGRQRARRGARAVERVPHSPRRRRHRSATHAGRGRGRPGRRRHRRGRAHPVERRRPARCAAPPRVSGSFPAADGTRGRRAPTRSALALMSGRPATVFCAEHWCDAVRDWVCWSVPVRDRCRSEHRRHRPVRALGPGHAARRDGRREPGAAGRGAPSRRFRFGPGRPAPDPARPTLGIDRRSGRCR